MGIFDWIRTLARPKAAETGKGNRVHAESKSVLPLDRVVEMACWASIQNVEKQIKNERAETNERLLEVVSDFVYGYALGLSVSLVRLNGYDTKSAKVIHVIIQQLQTDIERRLPEISARISVSISEISFMMEGGYDLGVAEPGRLEEYDGLRHVIGNLSSFVPAPGSNMALFCWEELGMYGRNVDKVSQCVSMMHARYNGGD